MIRFTFFLAAALLALVAALTASDKQASSKSHLTADQIAIYNAFFRSYDSGSPAVINLGNKTRPLEISENDKNGCLDGLDLDIPIPFQAPVHQFSAGLFKGKRVRLVDHDQQMAVVAKNDPNHISVDGKPAGDAVANAFATGLLEISEIVFDRTHHFAVMRYNFICGGLCGHGGTLVFEKQGDEWTPSSRSCNRWMS